MILSPIQFNYLCTITVTTLYITHKQLCRARFHLLHNCCHRTEGQRLAHNLECIDHREFLSKVI